MYVEKNLSAYVKLDLYSSHPTIIIITENIYDYSVIANMCNLKEF